jgi:hypothetical protein
MLKDPLISQWILAHKRTNHPADYPMSQKSSNFHNLLNLLPTSVSKIFLEGARKLIHRHPTSLSARGDLGHGVSVQKTSALIPWCSLDSRRL